MSLHTASHTVNLFIPCSMDMFSPAIPYSVVGLLEKLGDKIYYNPESTCCGRKFFMEGAIDCAKQLGEKLMSEYDPKFPMVVPSSACVGYIKNHFRKLFENVTVPAQLKQFTHNIYELCDYIVNVKGITSLGNTFNQRVFYFKSCAARNMYKMGNEPETLLSNTRGLDLLTDDEINFCCSANGRFAIRNSEVSDSMLKEIVDKVYNLGAQYITSTDIHCLQYIDAHIQSRGGGVEVIHIADILVGENETN